MSISDALITRAARSSTATLHEAAGRIGSLPSSIKPHAPGVTVCGRAYPVLSPAGDNLWLHHAIYAAAPGDVLVVSTDDAEFGYWGEVMAVAAQARGLAGLVITGGVRDTQQILALGFPVFSMGACIRGTGKNLAGHGSLGEPVTIGDVQINRGDLLFGDDDGVLVLPAQAAEAAIELGESRDKNEREIFSRLKRGETTLSIYGLKTPARLKNIA